MFRTASPATRSQPVPLTFDTLPSGVGSAIPVTPDQNRAAARTPPPPSTPALPTTPISTAVFRRAAIAPPTPTSALRPAPFNPGPNASKADVLAW
jgi:hypothetical protein